MSHNAPNRMSEAHGEPIHVAHVDHHVPYVKIFLTLVALTIITVAVAFLNIQSELVKVLLALTIASIKAAFVALFFMHLKFEGKLIRFVLFVPLGLTVILVCALIPDIVVPALKGTILAPLK